jgi:5S rRNA maturation endonuclease (ribonuclease M5)
MSRLRSTQCYSASIARNSQVIDPRTDRGVDPKYDFSALRAAHPIAPFIESRGVRLRRCGGFLVARCPIHRERRGIAFAVWPSSGRWQCFGKCASGGDVIDLLAKWEGISLAQAAERLAGSTPGAVVNAPVAPITQVTPYELAQGDLDRMHLASQRLATDTDLINRMCGRRPEWSPEVIRGLALEGDLGYEDLQGSVLFGYPHGLKRRWKDQDGSRRFKWECGSSHGKCWRQGSLQQRHHTVFITEGETDAITLISLGVERIEGVLVLALANGNAYPNPAAFADKNVFLVPDADATGQRCAQEMARRFTGIARYFRALHIGEVPCG